MISLKQLKTDEDVAAMMEAANRQIEALSYTEHSKRHCSIVSKWTAEILRSIGENEKTVELGAIAGYIHDIGNAVSRHDHAQTGALLAFNLLTKKGMSTADAAEIMMAIANHDETYGIPVSRICSALIIADKSDVHKSRVRNKIINYTNFMKINIHDRVNLAAEKSFVETDTEQKTICTNITINNDISSVMDYFEIYHERMQMCRKAAEFLGYRYTLIINDAKIV